ncbi:MAG: 30S ribosomal protein S16 [Deltaproteobacteria bacterium]|nr:MAG: 30S ribosomal protein S16 [Deltaproteobacteria bacterium]
MAVHLRLARIGTKKVPYYRIVAADQRSPRGGRHIERLGNWDPRSKELSLNRKRIQHWIDHGATPTATVERLIKRADVAAAAEPSEG